MSNLVNSFSQNKYRHEILYLLFSCSFLASFSACAKSDSTIPEHEFLLPTVASTSHLAVQPTISPSPMNSSEKDPTEVFVTTITAENQTTTPTTHPDGTLANGSTKLSEVDSMEMVYLPAGNFLMGSNDGDPDEKPVHEVYLDAYWIDKYEVTNSQYNQCIQSGECTSSSNDYFLNHIKFQDHPVTYLNWDQANTYCQWA